MPPKKFLPADKEERLREVWNKSNWKGLVEEFQADKRTISKWAKALGLSKKKKVFDLSPINANKITPAGVIRNFNSGHYDNDVENDPELKVLLQEFVDTGNNDILSDDERNQRLIRIMQKCIIRYISTMQTKKIIVENMAELIKLTLHQQKINNEGKDQEEIDKTRLKAIRKQAVNEAFDDILGRLSDAQKNLFNACLRVATKSKLAERKAAREAAQVKQVEAGITDAELIEH